MSKQWSEFMLIRHLSISGGPTGTILNRFLANIQYFSSQGLTKQTAQKKKSTNHFRVCLQCAGLGVLALNYRGSIGYGREYREILNHQWGITDHRDCLAAVEYLKSEKIADPRRIVVMGGSAGGFTTLTCLVKSPGVFAAGKRDFPLPGSPSNTFTNLLPFRRCWFLWGFWPVRAHYGQSLAWKPLQRLVDRSTSWCFCSLFGEVAMQLRAEYSRSSIDSSREIRHRRDVTPFLGGEAENNIHGWIPRVRREPHVRIWSEHSHHRISNCFEISQKSSSLKNNRKSPQ